MQAGEGVVGGSELKKLKAVVEMAIFWSKGAVGHGCL